MGASSRRGPSPLGWLARISSSSGAGRESRNASASSSQPRGTRKGASPCGAHPDPGVTRSVQANPPSATLVGMWLIDSIRFTCCPAEKLRQTWKSGSRTFPSRFAQSARVGLLSKSKGITFSTLGSRSQTPRTPGAQATCTLACSCRLMASMAGRRTNWSPTNPGLRTRTRIKPPQDVSELIVWRPFPPASGRSRLCIC